jgi:hypothetical protein
VVKVAGLIYSWFDGFETSMKVEEVVDLKERLYYV